MLQSLFAPSVTIYEAEEILQPKQVIMMPTNEELIRETFPEIPDLMIEVAYAESNMIPEAYNPEMHKGCQGSRGLFQIACVNYQGDQDDLFDPIVNIRLAREVYDRQGITAWGVCVDKVDCH